MKKLFSVFLATLMLFGMFAMGAGASGGGDDDDPWADIGNWDDRESVRELLLGQPVILSLSEGEVAWFRFTAIEGDDYRFYFDNDGKTVYGAKWYDEEGSSLGTHNWGGTPDYSDYRKIEEGETRYFSFFLDGRSDGDCTITVNTFQGNLKVKKKVAVRINDEIDPRDFLLKGTNWERHEVGGYPDGEVIVFTGYEYIAQKTGKGYIDMVAEDGACARVNITVRSTIWQWLYDLFIGWWWGFWK